MRDLNLNHAINGARGRFVTGALRAANNSTLSTCSSVNWKSPRRCRVRSRAFTSTKHFVKWNPAIQKTESAAALPGRFGHSNSGTYRRASGTSDRLTRNQVGALVKYADGNALSVNWKAPLQPSPRRVRTHDRVRRKSSTRDESLLRSSKTQRRHKWRALNERPMWYLPVGTAERVTPAVVLVVSTVRLRVACKLSCDMNRETPHRRSNRVPFIERREHRRAFKNI